MRILVKSLEKRIKRQKETKKGKDENNSFRIKASKRTVGGC